VQSTLVSTDAAYWRRCKDYIKPGDKPLAFQNRTEFGCPYDCGLCPDHEQHSCLALVEITTTAISPVRSASLTPRPPAQNTCRSRPSRRCSMPWWRAMASPTWCRSRAASDAPPGILPHSALARARPIRHVMINTTRLRIAREPDFVARLAEHKRGLEVYLQFDSLNRDALMNLRGATAPRAPGRLGKSGTARHLHHPGGDG